MLVLTGGLFLAVSSVHAETVEEYFNRGLASYSQGDLSQAISNYTEAIGVNPRYAGAYHNRGIIYFQQRNFIQAISDFNKAIEIDPKNALFYNNRGLAYYNRGKFYGSQDNFTKAISDFTKAIAIDPKYAQAYHNRGASYYMVKEYDQAWLDVYEVEGLGSVINPEFLNLLQEASGRDR